MFRSGHSRPIAPRFKPEYQEQHLFATDIVNMSFDDNDKLVILLAFAWAALIYFKRASLHSLPLPPGPKRLPLIGNLLNVPRTFEWETYTRWKKEFSACLFVMFGQTLFLIWIRLGHNLLQCCWHGGCRPEFA